MQSVQQQQHRLHNSGAHVAICRVGTGLVAKHSHHNMKPTTHTDLVLKLRMCGAIYPSLHTLPLHGA